jgi:thiamine pyrophosphate-dependent acetolactate synthase large subunit-like protein
MELETCVRHNIPIIVVVANNHGISGALKQKTFYPPDYPERVTMFQPGLQYEQIAMTLGCHGEFVEHPRDFRSAFRRAEESGKPACIHVPIDPDAIFTSAWGDTSREATFQG